MSDDNLKDAYTIEDDIKRISKHFFEMTKKLEDDSSYESSTPRGVPSSDHHGVSSAIQFSIYSELRKISKHLGKIAERLGKDELEV